jgi:hypothetical protein
VSTDASTVTLTLSHGTFANGQSTVSAQAVDGVATFSNLVINAAGSYVLRATDTNPNLDPGFAPFTINASAAAKLAFVQQPSNVNAGATISPAVTVAVEDANGNTVTSDASTVTLTLSSGTFAGGGNTVSAAAVNGVATFSSLVVNAAGTYTLAASDGSLTGATSSPFTVAAGTSVYDDFNAGSASFTSSFTVVNNGGANNTSLAWGAAFGVQDQPGPAAGGGLQSSGGVAVDSTAVYTPFKVNLADGNVHTLSEYVTAVTGLGTSDKPLQIGFLSPTSVGFNAANSFISARILGNDAVEFQSANGGTAVSIDNTQPTGAISPGDWLDLIFTARETASGSFQGTFSLVDYGPGGVGPGTTVLAPVSWTVSGLTNLGTASSVSPGFRTATNAAFTGHVGFDNFAVDPPPPARLAFLQQPSAGAAGSPLPPFVVAVEDVGGHTVSTDASTVTLTLSSGTFANGQSTASAQAVDGVATFSNLVISAAGTYTLAASDGGLTGATSNSVAITGQPTTTVDDAVQGTGQNQISYSGAWSHVTNTTIPNAFDGTVSIDGTTNDFVTIAFTGTQIKFYTGERNNRGIAAVSIDGGAETNVDLFSAADAGNVLVYTSPVLTAGAHTFKVRVTGTHDASSSGTIVCIDRFDILS